MSFTLRRVFRGPAGGPGTVPVELAGAAGIDVSAILADPLLRRSLVGPAGVNVQAVLADPVLRRSLAGGASISMLAAAANPTDIGGAVSPLLTISWDGYANTAALLADPLVSDESGSSGAVTLENVTGEPFSKVVRSTFLQAGTYEDHQIGITVTIPNAATHFLREIWLEYLVRYSGPYEADGPFTGNGGPGEKHLFLFDQEETGAGRWEIFFNIGGDSLQATFGGGYSSEKGGSGGAPVAYSPNMAAVYQNAGWNVIRAHGRMHATEGMWRFAVNGQVCPWGNVGNTDRGAGYYFNKIAVQRNINRGVFRDQYRETGPIDIYDQDPGWSWS
ncbi:hypothetical protein [Gaopeijia maritima]|uniref:hypothetical protein n=1 Tax=Gaopeijia maritima TaxID=3119007 RepID=UPI003289D995